MLEIEKLQIFYDALYYYRSSVDFSQYSCKAKNILRSYTVDSYVYLDKIDELLMEVQDKLDEFIEKGR